MSVEVNSTMTVRKTIAVAQMIPQYRHTEGQGHRKILTPDEVIRLPENEMLCIIRGCNILKINKLDYPKHPMAKLIRPTSVNEYSPTLPVVQTDIDYGSKDIENIDTAMTNSHKKPRLYSSAKPPIDF